MLGIVILNYNSYELVKKLCNNLEKVFGIYKIVIVDNNSLDSSVKELKKIESNKIILLKSNENKGYASGNNLGIKFITKKYPEIENICILNPDVEITDFNLFLRLKEELDKDKTLGIISPFMLMNGEKNQELASWKMPEKLDNIFLTLGLTAKLYKKFCSKKEVIPGSFLYFDVETIKEINYFDENTFLYFEENILCQKLKKIGKKMKIIDDISYNHNHEHKVKTLKNKIYHNKILFESIIYYEKNYNKKLSLITVGSLKVIFKLRIIEIYLKRFICGYKK